MVWEKVEDHPEEGHSTWEYRGEGITKRERVPSHFVPCTLCGKNWTMYREGSLNKCIFCSSGVSPSEAAAYASQQEAQGETSQPAEDSPQEDSTPTEAAGEEIHTRHTRRRDTDEDDDNPSRVRVRL